MSTGSNRNLRGVQVIRNAAGERIPEPVNASGEASPHAHFAQTFRTIAAGLRALPENVVDAVRALPESFFPPPWVFWTLLHVLERFADVWHTLKSCAAIARSDAGSIRHLVADPAIESDEFECNFVVHNEQINVSVSSRTDGTYVTVPVRVSR